MDVEYSLILKDVLAFLYNQAQRSAKSSKRWGLQHWILTAFVLIWAVSNFVKDPQLLTLLNSATLVLVGAWAGVMLAALKYLRVVRKSEEDYFKDPRNRFLFGSRRLSITAEGITISSEGFRDYLPWNGVVDVVVTVNHVFVYHGSINAQVVPKRAFRDQQHFEEFIALARQYQQGKGQQVPKPTGIIAGLPPQSDAFTRPDAP